ncbi:hypothetical protein GCM10027425_32350 [Alteromonas gracilis]
MDMLARAARTDGQGMRRRRRLLRPLAAGIVSVSIALPAGLLAMPAQAAAPVGQGFNLNRSDLRFILRQIDIAERHAATRSPEDPCGTLLGPDPAQIPDGNQQGATLPWGLRTVDGSCNNLQPEQERWGAADEVFPRLVPARFRDAEIGDPDGPFGPATARQTSYAQKRGTVIDSTPRMISNLISDQTSANPAAVAASGGVEPDASGTLTVPNTAPDLGLSAPFNSTFTLFGQFFDHGLDLVAKGGGTVYMPLRADDPLFTPGSPMNFMVLTRARNLPGPDGVAGDDPSTPGVDESADDVQEHRNGTTSYVDQNQTYTSHPSHQAFLREYRLDPGADGIRGDLAETPGVDEGADDTDTPQSTGDLISGAGGDGMATWGDVKAQALSALGIVLTDADVLDVPMLATDPYGNLELDAAGRPQIVTEGGLVATDPAGTELPADTVRTGHAFLDDIAHHAGPRGDANPADGPGPVVDLAPDTDPGTSDDGDPATYDDEMLEAHYVAGDGRANENIGLTAVHHVFHAEHNRLATEIDQMILTEETQANRDLWQRADGPAGWTYGQRLFQAARLVTEMEYQHLVFEEFARKVQPMVNLFGEGGTGYRTVIDASIRAEFAHSVYRFGHSMLTESVDRRNADNSTNDIGLIEAFLNPPEFTDGGSAGELSPDEAAGAIFRGMGRQQGEQIDEFITEALRNNLLGLPLDLATLNIARGRETGTATLNETRRILHDASADSSLAPYTSWADLSFALRTPETLVNLIAAYGTHPTVRAASAVDDRRAAAQSLLDLAGTSAPVDPVTPEDVQLAEDIADAYDFINSVGGWASGPGGASATGVDDIDLWVGGLVERPMVFGGMLGSTFNDIFEIQMEDLQDGDRFYYLSRTAGLNLLTQLEGNSFAELVMRNTDVTSLPADAFSRPDHVFEVAALGTSGPVLDDPATAWNERQLLTRMADGTLRYGGGSHTVFNGTAAGDLLTAGEGDDTLRGNDGPDRLQGGDGNDHIIGGLGDDILLDVAGDDVIKGGDGDDAISTGRGFGGDLAMGGRGRDFIVGGNDTTESFAGPGDDFIFAGDGTDTVFGDDGDDWIEDGKGPFSLLQGDNGAPFQDDPNAPGHDVLNGDGGEQDYDAEGGDDVMMAGPGIQRNEGMLGFDWVIHQGDPLPADTDMDFTQALPPGVETNRDRLDLVEALSGWQYDDVLRGDDRVRADIAPDHRLSPAGIARFIGLEQSLPPGTTAFADGNVILGGAGADTLEGRGGDDVLDGDTWLHARLSIRTNRGNPATEIGSAESMRSPYLPGSTTTLQQAVFAGTVDPGNIVIVREVLDSGDTEARDRAVFTGPQGDYLIEVDGEWITVTHDPTDGSAPTDGVDRLRNVELLEFADSTVDLTLPPEAPVIESVTIGDGVADVAFSAARQGILPVTGFVLEALVDDEVVRTVDGIAPTATTVRIAGLANDTEHVFQVRAVSRAGIGEPSAPSDPVVPTSLLESSVPANGADEVAIDAPLSATFARAVSSPTWTAAVLLLAPDGSTVPRRVVYDAETRTVRVTPTAPLAQGTTYTLRLLGTGGAGIRDLAGDRLRDTDIVFTTVPDREAPVVTAVSPQNGATGAARSTSPRVTFDEPVTGVGAGSVRLLTPGGAVVPATVSYDAATRTATIDPSGDLAHGTRYTIRVLGSGLSGVRDLAGNRVADGSWSFTTVADTTRPVVLRSAPTTGSTGVRRDASITVVLSEAITGVSATSVRLVDLSTGASVPVTRRLDATRTRLVVDPTGSLKRLTRYQLVLGPGVRDLAGNALATTRITIRTR